GTPAFNALPSPLFWQMKAREFFFRVHRVLLAECLAPISVLYSLIRILYISLWTPLYQSRVKHISDKRKRGVKQAPRSVWGLFGPCFLPVRYPLKPRLGKTRYKHGIKKVYGYIIYL